MSQSHALDCISHEQDSIPLLEASKKKKKKEEAFLSWLTQMHPIQWKTEWKTHKLSLLKVLIDVIIAHLMSLDFYCSSN